jgi:hypothetical protein
LVGKPEGKRPRSRWEDNIKMDLREIGFEGMDWIHLTQDRDPVMNLRVIKEAWDFFTSRAYKI